MRGLGRALGAEFLKIKRSLALWLTLAAPLVVVFLQFVLLLDRGEAFLGGQTSPWAWFGGQTIMFWSLLMLPLFITLETALVAGLEHGGGGWKHIFALPVSRGSVYAAKLAAGLALIALSMAALVAEIVLAGLLLGLLKPGLGLGTAVPVGRLLEYAGWVFLSSWLLIALHAWVGMRWRNFVVAVGFGIAMTIAAVLVINSRWANFYPWTLPALVLNSVRDGTIPIARLAIGWGGGVIAALLGGWAFIRRDIL